ncbi:hypothetical protein CTI12_AA618890 [Artemisia annua]|uniref:DUF4220 domain-containing protein n=1 Tax=Artemisia annua TaxID=35608 RepID=A0A2U1KCG4_ARTAN|nr:hypothetical protein CTI12_AA618890 [Artemisia annua]
MSIDIPPKWKQLWDTWNIRGFIILSISLQIFLILFAYFRKKTSTKWISAPLWSAYLLADWVAGFTIGLISSNDWNSGVSTMEAKNLYSFWASFLLVHLGGPDSITAFALADNELWLRHLVGLIFQCLASMYVFLLSLPHNELWIPTVLMFITGIMKYAERTRAFHLASSDRFRDSIIGVGDPGGNYGNVKLRLELSSRVNMKLPARLVEVPGRHRYAKTAKKGTLTELEVVQYGYEFFETFKGIIGYMYLSQRERSKSRNFFLKRTPQDGFKVVEVELNFIYDTFFTKLPVAYSYFGIIIRFFSFATITLAMSLFTCKEKLTFSQIDVMITYGLLYGALVIEIIAAIMLLLSNWTIIYLWKSLGDDFYYNQSLPQRIIGMFIKYKFKTMHPNGHLLIRQPRTHALLIHVLKRGWSESFSTYNLIDCCCDLRWSMMQVLYKKLGLDWFYDNFKYVKTKKCTTELRNFIYEELRWKSTMADDMETAKEIISSRGDWVLRCECDEWSEILYYFNQDNYDQSILIWHIATELCCNSTLNDKNIDKNEHREFARLLSGYMMYLHIMQPSMISATTSISQLRFRDTCETIKYIIQSQETKILQEDRSDYDRGKILEKACEEIKESSPNLIGYKQNSLLSEGCSLAELFMSIKEKSDPDHNSNKWVIISKVWLEMLCYVAVRSRPDIQITQMNKGCDLITIVWLLMAHFGFSEQFDSVGKDPDALLKLIVRK